MLNYTKIMDRKERLDYFSKSSKLYGILFLILGALGIIFPQVMSLTSAMFLGWLLLLSGVITAVQTWQVNKKDWLGWLKAIMYIVVSYLIIANPLTGVVALGIIFTSYFFIDSALNLTLALSIKPSSGWWMVLLNSILSFALGVYSLMALANPLKTVWLVGMIVGISLFFDGIMLISLSQATKEETK